MADEKKDGFNYIWKSERPDDSPKLDESDVSYIANGRYFKKRGVMKLLLWAAVTVAIAVTENVLKWPSGIAYSAMAVVAVIIVYIISSDLAKLRKRLKTNMGIHFKELQEKANANKA